MDYEQRYNEALERAKKLKETCDSTAIIGWCEHIFPELKGNEDRKIRNAIYDALKYLEREHSWDFLGDVDILDAYTWLEKQGKSDETKAKVFLINKGYPIDTNGVFPTYEEMYNIIREGLEQQSEQKSSWSEEDENSFLNALWCCKKAASIAKDENEMGTIWCAERWLKSLKERVQPKQGERKSVDKAEPKFKVGKWYQCTKDFFGKGVTFDKNTAYYCAKKGCLQDEYGCHIAIVKDLYDNFKLWTIQDAKDGDVLATDWYQGDDSWEKIIIFKKYHNKGVEGLIHTPCVEGYGNTFKNGEMAFDEEVPYYSKTWTDNLHPATKEQRDLLFARMKEEGCQWDKNKKEVIKL